MKRFFELDCTVSEPPHDTLKACCTMWVDDDERGSRYASPERNVSWELVKPMLSELWAEHARFVPDYSGSGRFYLIVPQGFNRIPMRKGEKK